MLISSTPDDNLESSPLTAAASRNHKYNSPSYPCSVLTFANSGDHLESSAFRERLGAHQTPSHKLGDMCIAVDISTATIMVPKRSAFQHIFIMP